MIKNSTFLKYFIAILFMELLGEILNNFYKFPYLIYIFKPLIIMSLIFWYNNVSINKNKILITALIFSFLGDTFLMFLPLNDVFFLAGLLSFFMTHIFYLYIFIKCVKIKEKPILYKKPYLILFFILYGFYLINFLSSFDSKSFISIKIPVICYMLVILLMVISSINRYGRVSEYSFKFVFLGAILFLLSDTTLSLNNFTTLFNNYKYLSDVIIMLTYSFGQYFIVKGLLVDEKFNILK